VRKNPENEITPDAVKSAAAMFDAAPAETTFVTVAYDCPGAVRRVTTSVAPNVTEFTYDKLRALS
jgi:hypothetical protein